MKRVLIYYKENYLKPIGGPAGYLYSLSSGMKSIQDDSIQDDSIQVDFLPGKENNSSLKEFSKTSGNRVIKTMLGAYRRFKHIRSALRILSQTKTSPVDLNQYDAVHFHRTSDVYYLRNELRGYKGKVILTSHSPQPLGYEIVESSSPFELKLFGKKYERLIEMDRFAFERADNIVFPCETADEPYLNSWQDYHRIKMEKSDAYRYMLTGTVAANPKRTKEEIRKMYSIPQNAFVISYVGRHNEIKGYNRLKMICKAALDKYPDAYVLVAGNPGPIPPLEHERWIEVGWTNDPHSIVAASDVFILPNKETYFDLVLLEVLSLGTLVIASNTGGNKYFEQEKGCGIMLFDSDEDALIALDGIKKMHFDEMRALCDRNRQLFQTKFTTAAFSKAYLNTLHSILD